MFDAWPIDDTTAEVASPRPPAGDPIGRDAELVEVVALLGDPAVRLVSFTGAGGIGKTTLARAAAERAAPAFPDGVAVVELAAERAPERLPTALVQALGLDPSPGDTPLETLAQGLEGRRLLVLDNLEQLAAGRTLGAFLDALLAACPGLTLLVTSRGRLGLAPEREVALPPLALPSPATHSLDEIAASPAVRLFALRASRANAAFTLSSANAAAVAELCRRLDGLPLALELGAARLGLLSAESLLARLDHRLELLSGGPRDAPSRHRSMRDAVGWSVEMLAPAERRLFALLSVFVGGCAREDLAAVAEAVLAEDEGASDVHASIDTLLSSSLLTTATDANGEPRLVVLASIRDVAAEHLARSGEEERARAAHAAHYRAFAEREGPRLHQQIESYAQLRVWNRIEADIDNVRAAASWFLAHGQPVEGLRAVVGLDWFWSDGAYRREGIDWIDRLLAAAGGQPAVPRTLWMSTHQLLSLVHERLGDDDAAERAAVEALRSVRETDDPVTRANVLALALRAARARGDIAAARVYAERGIAVAEASGQDWLAGFLRAKLASMLVHEGELQAAADHAERAAALLRQVGDLSRIPDALLALARAHLLSGDLRAAAVSLLSALDAAEPTIGTGPGEGAPYQDLFGSIAVLAHRVGADDVAAGLGAAAEAEGARTGTPPDPLFAPAVAGALEGARTALGGARFAAEWAAGGALTQDEQVHLAGAFLRGQVAPPLTGRLTDLTPRELEVLGLMADGRSNRAIAAALFISPETASKHVSRVLDKLGVPSRTAAATYAAAHGLRPSAG